MSVEMNKVLQCATSSLCHALSQLLPNLADIWWESCVKSRLSFQQQQYVERHRVTRLDQLDLAAFLRLVDQNWFELATANNWPRDGRHYVKEMQTVRNRWAHLHVAAPPIEDVYRDLDTLQRFLSIVCPNDELIQKIAEERKQLLSKTNKKGDVAAPPPSPSTPFIPGNLVRLRANPEQSGAITAVYPAEPETRYQVFVDGRVSYFYESQLEPAQLRAETDTALSLDEFHARLTALEILNPSLSKLYSLHAARIDVIPYQFRPVLKFIQSDRPRLLIADSVGVGKTIEAGLILREIQARRDLRRVLIICPRPLVTEHKWRCEMKRFDERFEHLDGPKLRFCISETDMDGAWPQQYERVILPFSLLSKEFLYGRKGSKGLLDLDPPPQFDLVIVDEAHHIRNTDTQRHQAVRFLCDNSEAVVFLTATPIQLGEQDLFVLLNTLRPDLIIDQAGFSAIVEPNPYINEAARLARAGLPSWPVKAREALDQAAKTSWGTAVLQQDPRFQEIYDDLNVSNSGRAERVDAIRRIEQLHTLSSLMNRTLRRDIGEFTQRKPQTISVNFSPQQRALHDAILTAQASIYAALHGDRTVNFLLTTIRRQAASCIPGLAPLLRDILTRKLGDLDLDDTADIDSEEHVSDVAINSIKSLIENALVLAEELTTDPVHDPKFQALRAILDQKMQLKNNKVMLFSTFRHTLAYLHAALKGAGFRVGLVHGGVADEERAALKARFEKDPNDASALDVLLFSEVGCEGLDYQFCDCLVNYDIPWNPMRIDQRIGRIDRWGQESEAVVIYNLITPGTVDADIYERCMARIGVFERALGANEAILGEITREILSVGENLALTEEERQAKLNQIADNGVRLVKEQQDLEARQTELFGLRLPKDQFQQDMEDATSYWLLPESLNRLVNHYLKTVTQKPEFLLPAQDGSRILRISQTGRDALLADFKKLPNRTSAIARQWQEWLKGGVPTMAVTFDPVCARKDRSVTLITPVHPLALQAAHAIAVKASAQPRTAIEISDPTLPLGKHPFAVYQWQYHGIRSDIDLRGVTPHPQLNARFLELLPTARTHFEASSELSEKEQAQIDSQHYRLWSDARAAHMEETCRLADFQRASLKTSHAARMAILDAQVEEASNDRIRIMKTAQKANAQADYERRWRDIDEASAKADILADVVAWGTITVRH